ncbi:hypothetical protein Slin15195_G100300 [Septoria linicola]|uniref:Uncharacterized protein n=1 Tax=Septoria linicola TaxID=215465 RepID=A0A9Q9B5I1_9PEZI|nr:hypothetical protein Slin15195_G100300 [Septoria linicola]
MSSRHQDDFTQQSPRPNNAPLYSNHRHLRDSASQYAKVMDVRSELQLGAANTRVHDLAAFVR